MNLTLARICLHSNAVILLGLSVYFFLAPFAMLLHDTHHPSLADGRMPKLTYRLHRQLTDDFESWAKKRTAAGTGASMDVFDISGTEWPMFSAVFYLWATEALHDSLGAELSVYPHSPLSYSQTATKAAMSLIVDPNNAAWVKKHWGEDYLNTENIFYRMLLISGLTSYQKLSGDNQHKPLLANQVETLAAELDASPHGLLDDYPNQCYPIDVLPAIAAILRADSILGTDHSVFAQRALRGFEGNLLDPQSQLPTYEANSKTGIGYGPARGVGISYMLIWAPELWPDTALKWHQQYDEHFWQENVLTASIGEFSKHSNRSNWTIDVDAGPVFAGIGTAASAFGIGAARANGRFDQAYSLSAEALVASWPLPNGTLLIPRLLSNLSDAPYVGEAALLFNFTRMSQFEITPADTKRLPLMVYIGLLTYLIAGLVLVRESIHRWRSSQRTDVIESVSLVEIQILLWLLLTVTGTLFLFLGSLMAGACSLFLASFLPRINPL